MVFLVESGFARQWMHRIALRCSQRQKLIMPACNCVPLKADLWTTAATSRATDCRTRPALVQPARRSGSTKAGSSGSDHPGPPPVGCLRRS